MLFAAHAADGLMKAQERRSRGECAPLSHAADGGSRNINTMGQRMMMDFELPHLIVA
jgi:hypothetical protein